MTIVFSSKEELYQRVKPALRAKKQELKRCGYFYIKEVDIWNYLIKSRWQQSHSLMLSDVVDDILNVDNKKLDHYVKTNLSKQTQPSNLEVI